MILNEKIELLPGGVNLRSHFLQLAFLMLEPELEVIQGGLQVSGITRA